MVIGPLDCGGVIGSVFAAGGRTVLPLSNGADAGTGAALHANAITDTSPAIPNMLVFSLLIFNFDYLTFAVKSIMSVWFDSYDVIEFEIVPERVFL